MEEKSVRRPRYPEGQTIGHIGFSELQAIDMDDMAVGFPRDLVFGPQTWPTTQSYPVEQRGLDWSMLPFHPTVGNHPVVPANYMPTTIPTLRVVGPGLAHSDNSKNLPSDPDDIMTLSDAGDEPAPYGPTSTRFTKNRPRAGRQYRVAHLGGKPAPNDRTSTIPTRYNRQAVGRYQEALQAAFKRLYETLEFEEEGLKTAYSTKKKSKKKRGDREKRPSRPQVIDWAKDILLRDRCCWIMAISSGIQLTK
jgi:hypothetical protein